MLAAGLLSGCGIVKMKIANYYLKKAEKIYSLQNPTEEKIEKAYDCIGKSLEWMPGSATAFELLDNLTNAAYRGGYIKSLELEAKVLRDYLKENETDWKARVLLINNFSLQGDIYSLDAFASELKSLLPELNEKENAFQARLALGFCYAAMLSWIESEGFVNLNRNPELALEKARDYLRAGAKLEEIGKSVDGMLLADPGLLKKSDPELSHLYKISLAEIKSPGSDHPRMMKICAEISKNRDFLNAVKNAMEGNIALINKDFSGARSHYRSALNNFPALAYAKKQLAEVDFQQGGLLALDAGRKKEAEKLLYSAYEKTDELVGKLPVETRMPFVRPDKFAGEIYSLKATIIRAINAVEKRTGKNELYLEREFEYALNKAVEHDPENRLAKQLLDRYAREGF